MADERKDKDADQGGTYDSGRHAAATYDTNAQYDTGGSGGEGFNPQDYLRIIYRRRWPAITVFLTIATIMLLSSYRQVSLYEGRAQLLIETEQPKVLNFQGVNDMDSNYAYDFYPTQHKILQSRALARRTLESQKLWSQFRSAPPAQTQPDGFSIRRWAGDVWRNIVPAGAAAPSHAETQAAATAPTGPVDPQLAELQKDAFVETPEQAAAINAFLGGLNIAPVKESRLVDVKFRSTNPALAMNAANGLARAYIEQTLEFKFETSKEASDWLGLRLAEQRAKVEESETALQRYREQGDAVALSDRQNIVVQRLTDLNATVTKAKTDRLTKEAAFVQIEKAERDGSPLDAIPAILGNGFVQQLKSELMTQQSQEAQMTQRLGDKHADMIKIRAAIQTTDEKLRAEIGKVVQSIKNEYAVAVSQEKNLTGVLEAQKTEALSLDRKGIEYGVLQREAESNRQIYNNLLQRAKETGVSESLTTSNIRIVDHAQLPGAPVFPNRQQDTIVALVASLFGGLVVAFFFEFLDSRLKTPDEIRHRLGVPFLGLIPVVSAKEMPGGKVLIGGVPPNFVEACRHIRSGVLFSTVDQESHSVLITSTGPGEGKTVVATNLALTLAQAGNRVLLIDADMRRPKVHTQFDEPQEPGLSNVLSGNAQPSQAIIKTSILNLWVLPAGRTPPNPAELLGSKRFQLVLDTLPQHFDWVVIDSPPIMAVTDASMVARIVSGVVFVVGADMTARQAAQQSIERLTAARATIWGAVLNRANIIGHRYYYSKYYKRAYESYYTQASE